MLTFSRHIGMNPQNKRIFSGRIDVALTATAFNVAAILLDKADAVNVHGVNITMGATPFGPDESFVGRWYVAMLPPSIVSDAATLATWIANLDTIAAANSFLESTDLIWGAGSIVCAEQSTFQHTFAPRTSRNAKNGSLLVVIMVADVISGVIDDWDAAATLSIFTSS